MFIQAIYEPTKEKCYVNTDYVIEIYPKVGRYLAYTFDNERQGYLIDKAEFDKFLEEKKSSTKKFVICNKGDRYDNLYLS